MNENKKSRNTVRIGANSNDNTIIQNSNVNIFYNGDGNSALLENFANSNQYDAIQTMFKLDIEKYARMHPLYPYYTAKYDPFFNKLISKPENEEAIKKYPHSIKGNCHVDRSQCDNIHESENPFEYSYRTQKPLKVTLDSYNEFLGELEDPYPQVRLEDIVYSIISPPEFPPAVNAWVESGNVSIPISIRRCPCEEFGKYVFCNVSSSVGFNLELTYNKENFDDSGLADIKCIIKKKYDVELKNNLNRELLFLEIAKTKRLTIRTQETNSIVFEYTEEQVQTSLYKNAPIFVNYFESLLYIESHTGCSFDHDFNSINTETIRHAFIIATSLKNCWTTEYKDFDNEVRCDYDSILSYSELFQSDNPLQLDCSLIDSIVTIQGILFHIEKALVVYNNVKINNVDSVRKSIKKKRKNILITMKPFNKGEKFKKETKYEGITIKY